jgi:uncharacterized protein (UPF0335 family)
MKLFVDDWPQPPGRTLRKTDGLRNVVPHQVLAGYQVPANQVPANLLRSKYAVIGLMRLCEECTMSVTDATVAAETKGKSTDTTRFAKDQLKAIVERIEHLEEEKKAISDDIRDVYAEAKGNGYDVKALRMVVRLRKQDKNERAEQEAILETYMHALGMT